MASLHWKICVLLLAIALVCHTADGVPAAPCLAAGCTTRPRFRRDVLESMKQAWDDMAATLKETGDKIVYTFQPTTSRIDGMLDSIRNIG